jgi:hypothetical protein
MVLPLFCLLDDSSSGISTPLKRIFFPGNLDLGHPERFKVKDGLRMLNDQVNTGISYDVMC